MIDVSGGDGDFQTSAGGQGSGGGAGGSVLITSPGITGSGEIIAVGGRSGRGFAVNDGGAGGGGRVAILVGANPYNFSGSFDVSGGESSLSSGLELEGRSGSYGSFYTDASLEAQLCDSGDLSSVCTITSSKQIDSSMSILGSGSLLIHSSAVLSVDGTSVFTISLGGDLTVDGVVNSSTIGNLVANEFSINGSMRSNILESSINDFEVSSGATLNASGLGNPGGASLSESGFGTGGGSAGSTNLTGTGASGGGGAGYGGAGGSAGDGAAGGSSYGSVTFPNQLGSGGGSGNGNDINYDGGAGGGLIHLQVSNVVTIDGLIEADGLSGKSGGGSGPNAGGAGSGGAIYISAVSIVGSGTLRAEGGDAVSITGGNDGGAGGGGRIALWPSSPYSAGLSTIVSGGSPAGGAAGGAAGSVYLASSLLDLSVSDAASVSEGGTTEFVVSLSGVATTDVTFDHRTFDGSATELDADFSGYTVPQSSTIFAGMSEVTIAIATTDDNQFENDEFFALSLSNASLNVSVVDDYGIATIGNNDNLEINFVKSGQSQLESVSANRPLAYDYSTSFDIGGSSTCALGLSGEAFCWGSGNFGKIGDGAGSPRNVPTAVVAGESSGQFLQISGGTNHTCGLSNRGDAFCWGVWSQW